MTKKKTVRTGIVGSGFSASFHYQLRRRNPKDVEVVGVHSTDEEQGKAYAESRGINFCGTLDALLDKVDAIHVCVPPDGPRADGRGRAGAGKFVVCEKPLTGYFGDGSQDFHWDRADKQVTQDAAGQRRSHPGRRARQKARPLYAENWVYAPAVQKEREILEKTGGQILWIHGEEAHSGSHSVDYAHADRCGGGC